MFGFFGRAWNMYEMAREREYFSKNNSYFNDVTRSKGF